MERILAVDGIEKQLEKYLNNDSNYLLSMHRQYRDQFAETYKRAVWIDSQLNGSCVVDPYFNFHFYEETDAMAFKLKWTDEDG